MKKILHVPDEELAEALVYIGSAWAGIGLLEDCLKMNKVDEALKEGRGVQNTLNELREKIEALRLSED